MKTELTAKTVLSLSGHDKGNYFLVLRDCGKYVLIADGKTRRLEKPKRKNRKHIWALPIQSECRVDLLTNRSLRGHLREIAGRFESIIN